MPTYTVTFMVDPAGAEGTIDGQTGTHTEGRWVFALPDGTYSYSVRAFGYLEKTGELTVQGGTVDESVTLAAAARFMNQYIDMLRAENVKICDTGTFVGMPSMSNLKPLLILYRETSDARFLDFA